MFDVETSAWGVPWGAKLGEGRLLGIIRGDPPTHVVPAATGFREAGSKRDRWGCVGFLLLFVKFTMRYRRLFNVAELV